MSPVPGADHVSTEELFRQHSAFVTRFLARLGVPPDHLDDALQEVFLVVHRHGGYRPGIAKPTSYLASIAIRAASQHRRKQAVARTRSADAPLEHMASDAIDPVHALQSQRDLARFQQALGCLPEELRTTLLLVEVEGESCLSVAAALGCPVGTIYWRLHQARKKLKAAIATPKTSRRPAQDQPAPAQLDEPAVPVGAFIMFGFFDFKSSEASRLLQRVRDEQLTAKADPAQLARHQELVRSSAELPAWASGWAPPSASWLSVIGIGPIAGTAAVGAITAALLLAPGGEDAPVQTAQPQALQPVLLEPVAAAPSTAVEPASANPPPVAAVPAVVEHAETDERQPSTRVADAPALRRKPKDAAIVSRSGVATPARVPSVSAIGTTSAPASTTPAAQAPSEEGGEPAEQPAEEAAVEQPQEEPSQPEAPKPEVEALRRADPTLAEMREVAQAEKLLATNPAQALAMARSLRERFEVGYFAEERLYVEVMALHRLGRSAEASDKAASFLRAYPKGPYTARVREALSGVKPAQALGAR